MMKSKLRVRLGLTPHQSLGRFRIEPAKGVHVIVSKWFEWKLAQDWFFVSLYNKNLLIVNHPLANLNRGRWSD